jgi:hypothetical protein
MFSVDGMPMWIEVQYSFANLGWNTELIGASPP